MALNEGKDFFVLDCGLDAVVSQMTDAQAGELFKHTLAYVNDRYETEKEEDDIAPELLFIWQMIKAHLKRDLKRWRKKVKQASDAGKKSAEARALRKLQAEEESSTNVNERQQTSTDSTDKTRLEQNRNKKPSAKKGATKVKKFKPPSVEDVTAYFVEHGLGEAIAKQAFEYYEAGNWTDSKGDKVKNWKQKMLVNWINKRKSEAVNADMSPKRERAMKRLQKMYDEKLKGLEIMRNDKDNKQVDSSNYAAFKRQIGTWFNEKKEQLLALPEDELT